MVISEMRNKVGADFEDEKSFAGLFDALGDTVRQQREV